MKLMGLLKLICVPLVCASSLALASPWRVLAPSGAAGVGLPQRVPADRYLDLGAAELRPHVPAYGRPAFMWEREAGPAPVNDESRYVDVARRRP